MQFTFYIFKYLCDGMKKSSSAAAAEIWQAVKNNENCVTKIQNYTSWPKVCGHLTMTPCGPSQLEADNYLGCCCML